MIALKALGAVLEDLHLKRFVRYLMRLARAPGIPVVKPEVLRVLPHDPGVHTQGLAYAGGYLYESIGLVGKSALRRIDIESGAVLGDRPVPDVWAEGIAVHGTRLVQLTYTEQIALIYTIPELEQQGVFRYESEGWGLAACREGYVMSDGSDMLTFRDAQFAIVSQLPVRLRKRRLAGINDLEFAHGRIYANVMHWNDIYEISRETGQVLRIIDCGEFVDRARRRDASRVLNGIAFVPQRDSFFITGKRWPMLFEVQWPK